MEHSPNTPISLQNTKIIRLLENATRVSDEQVAWPKKVMKPAN